MTTRREIARSLINGVWRTRVVDEDTGGNGGSSPVSVATKTVLSAEMLDLVDTPVVLLAGQGAGTAIVPLAITVIYTVNTTAYTGWTTDGNTGAVIVVQAGNGALFGIEQMQSIPGDFPGFDGYMATVNPYSPLNQANSAAAQATHPGPPAGVTADLDDAPLRLLNFGDAELAAGDGTFTFTIFYAVQDL